MCKPNYYSVIPAEIRYDKRLTLLSRMLYGEIGSLSNKEGYCWATNSYFADLYEVSNTTISNSINSLVRLGYITSELIYKEGSKEIETRKLKICVQFNSNTPDQNNLNTPIKNNLKDNIKNNNNINNNTQSSFSKNKYEEEKLFIGAVDHIVGYLNNLCNTKYKNNSAGTKKCIKARLKEGFSLQDFEKVIEWKYIQWGKKPTMFSNGQWSDTYLRPDTLFGNKFESYLAEANRNLVEVKETPIEENKAMTGKVLEEY